MKKREVTEWFSCELIKSIKRRTAASALNKQKAMNKVLHIRTCPTQCLYQYHRDGICYHGKNPYKCEGLKQFRQNELKQLGKEMKERAKDSLLAQLKAKVVTTTPVAVPKADYIKHPKSEVHEILPGVCVEVIPGRTDRGTSDHLDAIKIEYEEAHDGQKVTPGAEGTDREEGTKYSTPIKTGTKNKGVKRQNKGGEINDGDKQRVSRRKVSRRRNIRK